MRQNNVPKSQISDLISIESIGKKDCNEYIQSDDSPVAAPVEMPVHKHFDLRYINRIPDIGKAECLKQYDDQYRKQIDKFFVVFVHK